MNKMSSCPFSSCAGKTLKVPPVPYRVGPVVPNVAQPSKDIETTPPLAMGGTTAPQDSINQTKSGWERNQIFQVRPPHPQNTLVPCRVIQPPTKEKNPLLSNPNVGSHKCYQLLDTSQGIMGRVCTTPGTDGPLYSREPKDGAPNGNADWVRGNRFGVSYSQKKIKERPNYQYATSGVVPNNPKYVTYDPFYPKPGRCREKNCWYKTYPRFPNNTVNGYPTWQYPYQLREGFCQRSSKKGVFWIGVFLIMGSLLYGKY